MSDEGALRKALNEQEDLDLSDDDDDKVADWQQQKRASVLLPATRLPWSRPPAKPVTYDTDFEFMHVDTTYTNDRDYGPVIRLYGINDVGNSVLVHVLGFMPYFYAWFDEKLDVNMTIRKLETRVKEAVRSFKGKWCIINHEPCERRSITGYHCNRPLQRFYKITVAEPRLVNKARAFLDGRDRYVTDGLDAKTYEANVPFILRYMTDAKMSGCQWLKLRAGTFSLSEMCNTEAQYQFEVSHEYIEPIEKDDIAPLRVLSFDIEAKRDKPGFVNATEDPTIVVCGVLYEIGRGIIDKTVFIFGPGCDPVKDARMYVFPNETELLHGWSRYMVESDPDVITGYNIVGFDLPYMAACANRCDIGKSFMKCTRERGRLAHIKKTQFRSKAYGTRDNYEFVCEGRITYDTLLFMLRGQMQKLGSYTLNAVAKHFLGDQKVDLPYHMIAPLHNGSDADRAYLSWYCLKDALLPIELLEKLMAFVNGIEQARVTGIPLKWLLAKGQQIKTFSCILREKPEHIAVPTKTPPSNSIFTAGGAVADPIRGYYQTPIYTLDFASLYPSVMIADNVCYTTIVSQQWAEGNLVPEQYTLPPDDIEPNWVFVTREVQDGILPRILRNVLAARNRVKGMLKAVDRKKDPLLHGVYDGRQLALKLVANSLYGFLKAHMLTDPRLMSSVTARGREMIGITGDVVRNDFNARVVYGDTDSVMVDFGIGMDLWRGKELAEQCSALATSRFKPPNLLEFETIKVRSIYLMKKRYAALEVEWLKDGETYDDVVARAKLTSKGIQSKRRDNAPIGRETEKRVLEMILRENNLDGVPDYIKSVIRQIMEDRVDVSKFIITKGLSKAVYAGKQQHVELANRIAARSHLTGETPYATGDRVPYVMVSGVAKKSGSGAMKGYELAEDPMFAMKNGVPIDKEYYIYKQVMAGTLRVLTAALEPEKVPLIKSGMTPAQLSQFRAFRMIFQGDHMRRKRERAPTEDSMHGIQKWAKVIPKCMGCGCQTNNSDRICDACRPRTQLLFMARERELSVAQARYNDAWTRCQRCVGQMHKAIVCGNKMCDNFYHRERVIQDLEDLMK
jgi:DNA polymerase delta subunit 1